MRFDSTSFLLGLGVAIAAPLFTKVLRPLAVQVTAAGMEMFDEARRVMAEQMEVMEDIAAEARAKREETLAGAHSEPTDGTAEAPADRSPRRLRRQRSG
jgi:DNA-binding transcriptional LysR family regulator